MTQRPVRTAARRDGSGCVVDPSSFRVSTVDDFGGAPAPKRKSGPYTMACQMCRTRKVKCFVGSRDAGDRERRSLDGHHASRRPCQPCMQASLPCQWEVADGRKRRRQQVPSGEQHQQQQRRQDREEPDSHSTTRQTGPEERTKEKASSFETQQPGRARVASPSPSASFYAAHPDDGRAWEEADPGAAAATDTGSSTRRAAESASESTAEEPPLARRVVHIPGLASIFEAQIDATEFHAEPFIAELYPHDAMENEGGTPQDWSDLPDFVMGLGATEGTGYDYHVVDDDDGLDPNPSLSPAAVDGPHPIQTQGGCSGCAHSRQRPRLIRIRYYRRFGPTAVAPGLRKLSVVVDPRDDEAHSGLPDAPLTAGLSMTGVGTLESDTAVEGSGAGGGGPAAAAIGGSLCSLWDGSSPSGSVGSHASRRHLFASSSGAPRADMLPPILDAFFAHFGGHFPFHHPQILGGHVRSGEASSFLLNAIAALTLRFCRMEGPLAVVAPPGGQGARPDAPWQHGAPFLQRAKEQLVPLLSIPAPEVVAGLIILAWAEFGDNNEAGLWMFAGMAIRMAQDMGFHRMPDESTGADADVDAEANAVADPDADRPFHDQARPSVDGQFLLTDEQSAVHQKKARLVMFWSVFILDVCVSLVTGRPPSIRRQEIEVAVPTFADMKHAQLDRTEPVTLRNMVFPAMAQFMLLFSEAVEVLNERGGGSGGGGGDDSDSRTGRLAQIRDALLQRYRMLPVELAFSIDNYRAAVAAGQAGLYLLLHVLVYTFMSFPFDGGWQQRPHTQSSSSSSSSAPGSSHDHEPGDKMQDMALVSCQKTVQALMVAQLVDPSGYLATPFLNHSLFVMATTILQQTGSAGALLLAGSDFRFLVGKLKEQAHYFPAINSVVAVLEQRMQSRARGDESAERGSGASCTPASADGTAHGVDNSGMERVVSVHDPGIVNRYTIPGS